MQPQGTRLSQHHWPRALHGTCAGCELGACPAKESSRLGFLVRRVSAGVSLCISEGCDNTVLLLAWLRQGHGCGAAGAFTWLLYPAPAGFVRQTLARLMSCVPSQGACVRVRDLLLGLRSSAGKSCSHHKGGKQPQPLALLLLCSISWVGIPALQLAWLGLWHSELRSTLLCTVWSGHCCNGPLRCSYLRYPICRVTSW